MDNINKVPLVDILYNITSRVVVMWGSTYVYFDDKSNVDDATLVEATKEQEIKYLADCTAQASAEARAKLASLDWKVIRELERLMLSGTELNLERESLRSSIV